MIDKTNLECELSNLNTNVLFCNLFITIKKKQKATIGTIYLSVVVYQNYLYLEYLLDL